MKPLRAMDMIPTIRDLSPANLDLLSRQIKRHWPFRGNAGLYAKRMSRGRVDHYRLVISDVASLERHILADFASDKLLVDALPWLHEEMQKRRGKRTRMAA